MQEVTGTIGRKVTMSLGTVYLERSWSQLDAHLTPQCQPFEHFSLHCDNGSLALVRRGRREDLGRRP